ncbi:MAG: hypothetical protein ACHQUC_02510 [Chlamydiales bacterium]
MDCPFKSIVVHNSHAQRNHLRDHLSDLISPGLIPRSLLRPKIGKRKKI